MTPDYVTWNIEWAIVQRMLADIPSGKTKKELEEEQKEKDKAKKDAVKTTSFGDLLNHLKNIDR